MIDILILLLKPALIWESDPKRYWYLTPLVLVAVIADIVAAHTVWRVVGGAPQQNEWTISHTLERLCRDSGHPDHQLFVQVAKKINRESPTGRHINSVL